MAEPYKSRKDVRKDIDKALRGSRFKDGRRSDQVEDLRGVDAAPDKKYVGFGMTTGLLGGLVLGRALSRRFKSPSAKQAGMGVGVLTGGAAGLTAGDAMAKRYRKLHGDVPRYRKK